MNTTEIYDELIRTVKAKPGFENAPILFVKMYIAVKLAEYLQYLDEVEHTNRFAKCMAAVTEKVQEKFSRKNEVIQNEEVF